MPEPTTRLHVWITGYDEEDEEKIKRIMKENDFPIQYSHTPSDEGIEFQSYGFGYNDESLALVQQMKEKFEAEFPSRNVELEDGTLGEHVAIDYFECVRITDDTNNKTEDRQTSEGEEASPVEGCEDNDVEKQTCPECQSNSVDYDGGGDLVCLDCGLVINLDGEESTYESPEWRAFADSDGEQKERVGRSSSPNHSGEESTQPEDFEVDITYRDDAPAPETADEWRMWYPCPECKSTALDQIVEQHLSVSATDDGSYGGDRGGIEEYNYIECSDCGEVLLDEIGRD